MAASVHWSFDEYDSKDSNIGVSDGSVFSEPAADNNVTINSTESNHGHAKPESQYILGTDEIFSQLTENGCEDASTQLDWSSIGSTPMQNQERPRPYRTVDTYCGNLKSGQVVAVRCPHLGDVCKKEDLAELKNVAHEMSAWSKCKHPNVLGLIGVAKYLMRFAMICPWTDHLDLQEFLFAHPQADRHVLSTQIAYGVAYLHGKNLVHGSIFGDNINVTWDHIPKITGFCEVRLFSSRFALPAYFSQSQNLADRWMPPEIIMGENEKSIEGDVYSLAMTILEAITGAEPYEGLWNGAALLRISNGHHPQRPITHIPYEDEKANMLWTLLCECWSKSPENRPTSVEVLGRMTDVVSGGWMRTSCQCVTNLDDQRDRKAHTAPDTIIHRQMSVDETLSHLYEHGCRDATRLINQTEYSIYPVSYGGFGEVYRGRLKDGSRIALKCLRLILDSSNVGQKQVRNAAHELYIWSKCNHPNVLELIGVTQYRNQIAMVSPWMEHGTLGSFISKHPQVDRYTLSAQIVDGVAYLHGENLVHGDIKGANILISKDHTPKITDFGTATLREYTLKFTASATTSKPGMSLRWTAPEILEEVSGISFEGDIYALGMTILEAITGEVPYSETVNESALVLKIARQEHPVRPETKIPIDDDKSNSLWSLLTNCWSYDPEGRPAITEVQNNMRVIASGKFPRPSRSAILPNPIYINF